MTHYTIDYTGMSFLEFERKAVEDCRFYLGEEEFERIVRIFRENSPVSEQEFVMNCAFFIGIEGPPVGALYRHCFPFG